MTQLPWHLRALRHAVLRAAQEGNTMPKLLDTDQLDGALGGWITKIGRVVGLEMEGPRCSEVWLAVCKMRDDLDKAKAERNKLQTRLDAAIAQLGDYDWEEDRF